MAKVWSGFAAQNQNVLEQWGVLEATTRQINALLSTLPRTDPDAQENSESSDIFAGWPFDPVDSE